jgi:hypothetical protein
MSDRIAEQVLADMVAMFDSGDASAAPDVVADAYLDHQGLGGGPMLGAAGFIAVVKASWAGFEYKAVTIEDLFGTQDRAVARIRWRGRHHDGEKLDRETIDIIRIEGGLAVEHWGAHS